MFFFGYEVKIKIYNNSLEFIFDSCGVTKMSFNPNPVDDCNKK